MAQRNNDRKENKIDVDKFISAANLRENWGLIVHNATHVRAVVKIETNKGTYALKKVNYMPIRLNFIYEAQEYLWQNGFQNQSRWLVTLNGQPFVQSQKYAYFLTQWIDGRECNLKEPDQLTKSVKLQAALHKTSQGFTPSTSAMINTKWDHLITDYETNFQEILTLDKKIRKLKSSDLVSTYLKTADPMIKLAKDGLELLKASPYEEVLNLALNEKGFVHGDFLYHNFIQANDGEMYVIDFDLCSQDLRVTDFACFLRKFLRRMEWDINLNHTILQTYHDMNPILNIELEVLKALLHFPKQYWKNVKLGFELNRLSPKETIGKLQNEAMMYDKLIKYLNAFPTNL